MNVLELGRTEAYILYKQPSPVYFATTLCFWSIYIFLMVTMFHFVLSQNIS